MTGYTVTFFLLLSCTTIPEGEWLLLESCMQLRMVYTSADVLGVSSLKVSENNGSSVFVEMLRGRDGLPRRDGPSGRNGEQGPAGPPGPPGPRSGGAHLHQVGEEFLPTSGRHRVSLLWHHLRYLVQPRRRWSQLPVYASGPTIQPHTHIQKWSKQSCLRVWGRVQ